MSILTPKEMFNFVPLYTVLRVDVYIDTDSTKGHLQMLKPES